MNRQFADSSLPTRKRKRLPPFRRLTGVGFSLADTGCYQGNVTDFYKQKGCPRKETSFFDSF